MGHVDTGKTKLLDNIRRTNVQDGEAGGITQQIGASFFPRETLVDRMGSLVATRKIDVRVPGLMIIDTPGHESFSNLRSRGSSLCDLAILVIDIMHGLEPQTIESLTMLRSKKTPFIIALNKVDRCYGWKQVKDRPFLEALAEQPESTQQEFETRASNVLLQLAEQGLNAKLYYKNKDFKDYVSLVPTSAITGEGVPDILMMLVQLSQKMLVERIMWCPDVQCTVLEVKVVEGLGATADVILANGTLKRGDRIVMCGFGGPVVTRVRELLTPKPLREIRVKTDFLHHQSVDGAQGIKICANHLEGVVAGSAAMVPYADIPYDLECCKEEVMGDLNKLAKAASEVNGGIGVYAIASTLGSLEALLEFLKSSKIPVAAVNIGPIHKKDVIKASIMHEHKPEYATILAFDVPLTKEGGDMAKELNVKIFTAEIIYHLFDKFMAYMAEVRKQHQEAAALTAVFPCVCEISSPEHVWCRGGGGDPILVGMNVVQGTLKKGTPLCVERRGAKDPSTGLQAYLDIGRVSSIEVNRKAVDFAKQGQVAAVKIDAVTSIMFGRQFDHTFKFYSRISRRSIDALKEFFREDLERSDLDLLVRLKKQFGVI
jgi:translation initiation factor 5B